MYFYLNNIPVNFKIMISYLYLGDLLCTLQYCGYQMYSRHFHHPRWSLKRYQTQIHRYRLVYVEVDCFCNQLILNFSYRKLENTFSFWEYIFLVMHNEVISESITVVLLMLFDTLIVILLNMYLTKLVV
jgi:hypothetical protein